MAGSYNHCVEKPSGKLLENEYVNDMLENGGDVFEAVEEMYGMIWYLAGGDPDKVAEAERNYVEGLKISPGTDGTLPDEDS